MAEQKDLVLTGYPAMSVALSGKEHRGPRQDPGKASTYPTLHP